MQALGPLRIANGEVIIYRLFEAAYAIELAQAEAIWRDRAGLAGARKRLQATPAKAVAYDVPPLVLSLETVTLTLADGPVTTAVSARLYDFGVITVALRIAARDVDWAGFAALLNAVNDMAGSDKALWDSLIGQLVGLLRPSLVRPAAAMLEEDYIVGLVRAFDRPVLATEIQALDLVPLLSGERMALSPGARQDLLRNSFSYYTDDLAVLTWDRAFLYEPRGDSDVIDVLEVANAQLLEMRYYDELLDDELPSMYDLVETTRRSAGIGSSRRFSQLARRLYALVAEVTELTEKVDNALQVTEDVYLARIYSAALDLFRVGTVSAAVDRKLAIIRDTYAALYEEASSGRAAAMELAIVVLIVVEIVLALLHR
ncbi:hypothetical protein [Lichenicoccus sp.]|uniref:hypothetical protein n=1 Tax=Lichenicoccus sp. TaxID=2781899 RepID=UPI003D122671